MRLICIVRAISCSCIKELFILKNYFLVTMWCEECDILICCYLTRKTNGKGKWHLKCENLHFFYLKVSF